MKITTEPCIKRDSYGLYMGKKCDFRLTMTEQAILEQACNILRAVNCNHTEDISVCFGDHCSRGYTHTQLEDAICLLRDSSKCQWIDSGYDD